MTKLLSTLILAAFAFSAQAASHVGGAPMKGDAASAAKSASGAASGAKKAKKAAMKSDMKSDMKADDAKK